MYWYHTAVEYFSLNVIKNFKFTFSRMSKSYCGRLSYITQFSIVLKKPKAKVLESQSDQSWKGCL